MFFTHGHKSFTIIICFFIEAIATNNFRVSVMAVNSNPSIKISYNQMDVMSFDLLYMVLETVVELTLDISSSTLEWENIPLSP